VLLISAFKTYDYVKVITNGGCRPSWKRP
jgi:hypothetical protein